MALEGENIIPNIQKIDFSSIFVKGFQVRTKNTNEMNVETQKIAPLWGKFYAELMPTLKEGATVYAVYHNYESDAMGEFAVLVGADVMNLTAKMKEVTLEAGKYLMFPVKGELAQAIIETWAKVWAYFEDESIDERRSFKTDFEKYISADEAEIYIGVNYL